LGGVFSFMKNGCARGLGGSRFLKERKGGGWGWGLIESFFSFRVGGLEP
jgi:hypothetical protein